MRGHEEGKRHQICAPYLFEVWDMKDPVKNFEQFLLTEQVLDEEQLTVIKQRSERIHRSRALHWGQYIPCSSRYRIRAGLCVCPRTKESQHGITIIDNTTPRQSDGFSALPEKRLDRRYQRRSPSIHAATYQPEY